MAATAIPTFINYDTSEKVSSTGGPELFGHSRTTVEADATWTGLQPVALGARLRAAETMATTSESSKARPGIGPVDATPNELWLFSFSAGFEKDGYDDSYFRLQESTFRNVTVSADFSQPGGRGGGGICRYERFGATETRLS
jgi:hypothetical protein